MKRNFYILQCFFSPHYVVNLSLSSTKNDKNVVIRLHAQVCLHVVVWWSKDGQHDCLLAS